MFNYLWSRILLVVGGVVLLTALFISFFAQKSMENAIFTAEDRHAVDLLNSAMFSIDNEYRSLIFSRMNTLELRKQGLKNIVTLAIIGVQRSYELYRQGFIDEEEAKRQAIEELRKMRYDNGVGYVWISNLTSPLPRLLMHPVSPDLEGITLDDQKYFTALGHNEHDLGAMADVCRRKGEGYIEYLWPKPTESGLTPDQPKISYVKLFKEWDWVVGTGVYVDDIEAEATRRFEAIVEELKQTFRQVKIAQTGYLFLFNGKKEMLIHPNISGFEFAAMKNPDSGRPIVDELIEVSRNPQTPFDYTWDKPGHERDYRFKKRAYVFHYEPLDWYIGSSVYIEEIAYHGKALRQRIIYISLVALALAFIFSIALAKTLTAPLEKLIFTAENIEKKGLLSAVVPVTGTVETRQLGAVLNRMLESISDANLQREKFLETLEQRVEGRTAELALANSLLGSEVEVRKRTEAELRVAMHQLQHLNKELERLAATDPLTGANNRRNFFTRAGAEISRATRASMPISLLALDIDHFKQVNDRYGHQAGDEVLKAFVRKVLTLLRPTDIFARIGGEEFTVLLPGTNLQVATEIAERIRCAIKQMTVTVSDAEIQITVSIGVAQFGLEHANIERLIGLADERLYIAKSSGRDRVVS